MAVPSLPRQAGTAFDSFETLTRDPQVLDGVRRIVESADQEVAEVERARKRYVVPELGLRRPGN